MSDRALRELEREVLRAPADLDLRRRHARALQRAGDEERALAALDLAWRLGADELLDEVRAGCEARRLVVCGVTLCYVPGGPFAMGADDQDDDAAPLHLVHLSPFYVTRELLPWWALEGWRDMWPLDDPSPRRAEILNRPADDMSHVDAASAVAYFGARAAKDGAPPGRWSLISEAQWERLARAALLTPDGSSPYGVVPADRLEWTADAYDPGAYGGVRRDPRVVEPPALDAPDGATSGGVTRKRPRLFVLRGVPVLPPPMRAVYREAASSTACFEVEDVPHRPPWRGVVLEPGWLEVRHDRPIGVRPVLEPERRVAP